jgi:hypothetical protein
MGGQRDRGVMKGRGAGALIGGEPPRRSRRGLLGIVVVDGVARRSRPKPRMAAFMWGSKVAEPPTLPFGRWKSVA